MEQPTNASMAMGVRGGWMPTARTIFVLAMLVSALRADDFVVYEGADGPGRAKRVTRSIVRKRG